MAERAVSEANWPCPSGCLGDSGDSGDSGAPAAAPSTTGCLQKPSTPRAPFPRSRVEAPKLGHLGKKLVALSLQITIFC